jgi:hypothetical protein
MSNYQLIIKKNKSLPYSWGVQLKEILIEHKEAPDIVFLFNEEKIPLQ